MIVIFTYQRPQMLARLLRQLEGCGHRIVVIDDGTTFKENYQYAEVYHKPHYGKAGFWKHWDFALKLCRMDGSDHFMFLQDDYFSYDIMFMEQVHRELSIPYAFEFRNMGILQRWTMMPPRPIKICGRKAYSSGHVDCVFSCNRKALEEIDFKINKVNPNRFDNPKASSGVGKQLSHRFLKKAVAMLKPHESLCKEYRGTESKMNPEERAINKNRLL